MRSAACARWFWHVNGVNPTPRMRAWLTDTVSLTLKLMACGKRFDVRCLRQERGLCLPDESSAVKLPRRRCVREREVLLECDGRPVVYAHTIMPLSANTSDWPFFGSLGERSLGTTLFGDPRVVRGSLQYARLHPRHPLMRRAFAALDANTESIKEPLYARRCLYRRRNGMLLVTEVFLPALADVEKDRDAHGRI
jgi:chorismate--pyruvate lyase